MKIKKFLKKVENFICENCGEENIGNGYTNHCKKCLFSKHVDVNPGDRLETCGGMMVPDKIDFKKGEYTITHKCLKCEIERKNILDKNDNFDATLSVAKKAKNKYLF